MADDAKTRPGGDTDADWGLVENAQVRDRWERSRVTGKDRLDWLFFARHKEPNPPVTGVLEPPPVTKSRVGICCSGGGIRSASFNLGALQTLQKRERLERAKYLAAVSGGAYIASAFAMVAKNVDTGPPDPPGDDSHPGLVTSERPPFYEGSPEEQYLRNHLSYLAPQGQGRLLLVWRIFLGLFVNLLLIGATVMLLAVLLAVYYESAHPGLDARPASADANTEILAAGAALAGVGLAFGLALVVAKYLNDDVRRGLEVWSFRLFALGLLVVGIESVMPALIVELRSGDRPGPVQLGGGFSATAAAIVSAVVVHARARFADPVQAIRDARTKKGPFTALPARLRALLIYVGATVAGPLLVIGGLVAAVVLQLTVPEDWRWLLPPAIALAVFAWLMYFGDLTSWSLHPFYRRRLCTAFAIRRTRDHTDDEVGYAVEREQGDLVPLSETAVIPREDWRESKQWPTLIVCAAANVSDPGVTPPGRGVTSFTFSAHAMGGPLVGGIRTNHFETALPEKRRRDFTLPAVVAMSGAALSPSMGKITRPSIRFLLALANIRLGVWIANPRRVERFVNIRAAVQDECEERGQSRTRGRFKRVATLSEEELKLVVHRAWTRAAEQDDHKMPRPRPHYLLKELLGWNSINDPFLYISDGGHYENLGLVELLRRGCTHVYCFDASGGEPLAALGDAVALARSELGVEISFPSGQLEGLQEEGRYATKRAATGTVMYPGAAQPGRIVYAPTTMTEGLPIDVQAFRVHDKQFPRHSTLDQFFSDQKFEAYRVLGCHAAGAAIAAMEAQDPPGAPPSQSPDRRAPARG